MSAVITQSTTLTVAEDALATAIGITAPTDPSYAASALTVVIAGLPANGTLTLADGVTPITNGETLTVGQLIGLAFVPTPFSYGTTSPLTYIVRDPSGASATGTATLAIGAATIPVVTYPAAATAAPGGGAVALGITAPTDPAYGAASLTVKVGTLPGNGRIVLADGTTAVTAGETLTVAQLTGLEFIPGTTSFGQAATITAADSLLTYTVLDPAGHSAGGSVLTALTPTGAPLAPGETLTVAPGAGATPIGINAPSDPTYGTAALTFRATALPANGTVLLSDGVTPVTAGEALTYGQLLGLTFRPATGAAGQASAFTYQVSDPSGATATGTATLTVAASGTALVTTAGTLTVAENSGAAPIGIQTPSDGGYAATALSVTVTALPNNGTVLLADGKTAVTVGETLTVAQLTGLEFAPTRDNTGKSSTFAYTVSDPAGHTAAGSVTLVTGPNPIVLENELPGTPESVWQVPDSTNIQGFTTQISTNVGGTVSFKIETNSDHYRIDIYRIGYYGGDGARLVGTVQHQAGSAILQPTPMVDAATGMVDAGNWSVTDTFTLPSNAPSGVYVADLVREDGTTGTFQIPFVVTDPTSHSDIVFQTADQTWQAYNGWGGANLYGATGSNPYSPDYVTAGPGPGGAAFAVSYNRPIVTQDSVGYESGPQDSLFSSEYAAIQWLEQNGYDVSYISGIDASTNPSLLLNHKVYMDAGHDEYWTGAQQANVQAAINAGVNAQFLSGNEMFWQTRLEPSIAGTVTANRSLVSYKETHQEALTDPASASGVWTGSFLDQTFGAQFGVTPSNAITGTAFQVDANQNATITIPYADTQLRIWRNTPVAATPVGQTASLSPGLLGYEWDSAPDNGFMPAGLIDVSSTTLNVTTDLLDYGNTVGNGTATHNLVEYRDPVSGALVFGAGTVFWSWGLSADHLYGPTPGPVAVDPSVQQAEVNLFADMGVQPSTLQATLKIATASTDHTPPVSAISALSVPSPVEGQTVTVTGTASDVGGLVAGVQVSYDSGKTWHPATGTTNWSYSFVAPAPGTYTVESRATDDSLNTETPTDGQSYTVTPSSALSLYSAGTTPATLNIVDSAANGGVELGMAFTSATSGQITAIRFYKGSANTGTHVGHLWTSTGQLLASVTFTNETASGWQQAALSQPVKIAAGTTYIVSYNTSAGDYSATNFYFNNPTNPNLTVGSLSPVADGHNGLYSYGPSGTFPSSISNANYFVDVVFNDTSQGPQANDVSGLSTTEGTALSIPAATLLAGDTDPQGYTLSLSGVSNPVNGTVAYNAATQTVTFTPAAGFAGPADFTYTISDGHGGSASGNVAIAVNYPATAQSLFSTATIPATPDSTDPSSVELGMKFTVAVNGSVTGVRFYKGPTNTGTHTGELWSSTGTLLATATFTGETASGWQQVNFSQPVPVTAGTTYVVSYHSGGYYAADGNYFTQPVTDQQITAPAGGNGVYGYASGMTFPTSSYNATNYYVDVVFNDTYLQPVAANVSGASVTENTATSFSAASLLAGATDPYGYALSIGAVSNPAGGTVSYDASAQTVTFTPTAGYTGPGGFNFTVVDGHGGSITATDSLTVTAPPPVVANVTGLTTPEGTAETIPAATLLAGDTDPRGLPLSITGVSNPSGGTVSYNASAQTVTFTPTAGYAGPASFTFSVTDGQGGFASATAGLTVTYPASAQSLFYPSATPTVADAADGSSVELGVKFTASTPGEITGIRFYKGPSNTGTHTGELWSVTGQLLASATFSNETASGWQQVTFANPVVVQAGTTYVASYHTSGYYAADSNYFANPVTNGALTAPASGASGGNGVYAYGGGIVYPSNSYGASNYWVDVVFNGAAQLYPTALNHQGLTAVENAALAVPAATLLAGDTDPYNQTLSVTGVGSPTNGTVSYNTATQTANFVPAAGYTGPASFTYTISDTGGATATATVSLTVQAAPNPTATTVGGLLTDAGISLAVPASYLLANDSDPSGYALTVTGVGAPMNGTVSYSSATQSATFVPAAGYTGPASFTYTADNGHGGTATATANLMVEPATVSTLFSSTTVPATITANDNGAVELGVRFESAVAGDIVGVRFFKGPQNTGTHTAELWNATGSLLATATFTNETAGGWQEADFAMPVPIAANTIYVASYHTGVGHYSATANGFASSITSGPLTAPASGGNGVYAYGSSSVFPTQNYNATNYGVDVVFNSHLAA
ncbi:DUF4082 domain-containing protein [Acidisphaera rubrifaciens]|uniref:DUF4082 domain-containing protein n=1 Tax=Acidisphaera rubrifaciens HS-AP3 TaxID=1231350 RepID=A0A0D6P4A3_9PROT|nr:DUF4082 domain-containing protein [Acidisphaera rubrifaciens]GAN76151.1 hypothetical protein Asru_0063_08 [Acidisphaera rubrifaciens HS-AP3]